MGGVPSAIGLAVLSNFATDLIKWAAKTPVSQVEEAIRATENLFPSVEGVAGALRLWLSDQKVRQVINRLLGGLLAIDEVPVSNLVSAFLSETDFFLPDHAAAVAEKIVGTFLIKIRAAYLADSQFAGPYLANRFDTQERIQAVQYEHIMAAIDTVGGLKPSLDRMFKRAVDELENKSVETARFLLESLLSELKASSVPLRQLERAVHAKLGNALSRIGETDAAAAHLMQAAALDHEDPVRAAINAANAEMLLNKAEKAHRRLDSIVIVAGDNLFNYWHTKAMALVAMERFDEALAIANRSDIGGAEDAHHGLKGAILLHARRFSEAERAYLLAISANSRVPEWHFGAGEMMLMPLVDEQNQAPFGSRSQEFVNKLQSAEEHFREAASLFRNQGRSTAAIHTEEKLALALFLEEKHNEGIRVLEPAVQSQMADRQNLVNLAFGYLRVHELGKASNVLKQALMIQWEPGLERMYIHALINQGKATEAITFLQDRTTPPITEDNLESFLSMADAMTACREYSKTKALLEDINAKFPSRADVLLSLAEFQSTVSPTDAATAFESALRNSAGQLEALIRVQYGHFCMQQEEFARAVEVWKPLMREGGSRSLQKGYMVALFNSRAYTELIQFSEVLISRGDPLSVVGAQVLSAAYEHLDELEPARRWLEYVCAHDGNRPEHIRRLAQIELRLGHRDKALDLLDGAIPSISNATDLLEFAKAYSLLGRAQRALDLAFGAAQKEQSAEIYSGYVGAFLAAGDDSGLERSPEQIGLFQFICSNFEQLFPDAKQIQTFHVDPEDPLESMRKVLVDHAEVVERASEAYKNRQLPLTTFAKAIGRDMFEVWRFMLGSPDFALVFADGSEDEARRFHQLLIGASGIIIDPVALFTLHRLKLLNRLFEIGDVYVAQPALDYLHYMQSKRKIGKERGSMGFHKGEFFMTEISADAVASLNAELDEITSWVECSGVSRGFASPLSKEQQQWIEPLGEATLGTIAIAKQRSALLVTDDKVLANVAAQTHGIEAVNSQAILVYLLGKASITETEYAEAVLKLVEDGYTFVRVNEEHFFLLLDREDFQLTSAVTKLFRILESPTTEINSACSVTAGLLRRLFREVIPTDVREPICSYILDALTRRKPKEEVRQIVSELVQPGLVALKPFQSRMLFKFLAGW